MADPELGVPVSANDPSADAFYASRLPVAKTEEAKVDVIIDPKPVDMPKDKPQEKAETKAPEEAEKEEADSGDDDEAEDDQKQEDGDEPHRPKRRSWKQENIRLTRKNRELREENARLAVDRGRTAATQTEQPKVEQATETTRPKQEDFQDYESFSEALIDYKVGQRLKVEETKNRQRESERQMAESRNSAMSKVDASEVKARAKYNDYDEVARSDDLKITATMVGFMAEMDEPAEVAYWLGQNPQEALRISNLNPAKIAIALGKIEAGLGGEQPKPKAKEAAQIPETKAPPPTKTVTGGTSRPSKALEELSQDEYYRRRTSGQR